MEESGGSPAPLSIDQPVMDGMYPEDWRKNRCDAYDLKPFLFQECCKRPLIEQVEVTGDMISPPVATLEYLKIKALHIRCLNGKQPA